MEGAALRPHAANGRGRLAPSWAGVPERIGLATLQHPIALKLDQRLEEFRHLVENSEFRSYLQTRCETARQMPNMRALQKGPLPLLSLLFSLCVSGGSTSRTPRRLAIAQWPLAMSVSCSESRHVHDTFTPTFARLHLQGSSEFLRVPQSSSVLNLNKPYAKHLCRTQLNNSSLFLSILHAHLRHSSRCWWSCAWDAWVSDDFMFGVGLPRCHPFERWGQLQLQREAVVAS